jgi:hypothetical protein
VGRLAVPGRELDWLGHRHPGRVQGDLGPGNDVEATSWHMQDRHGRAGRGAGTDKRQAISHRPQIRLERGVRNRQVGEPTRSGVEQAEPVTAAVPVATGDAPISDECIVRVVELPRGVGELGRHRQRRLDLAVALSVQVPPAGRSETRCRTPSAFHSGCTTDSCGPPATWLAGPSLPSGPRSATHRSAPSHGMHGRSQVSQARRRPSGLGRGAA